MRSWIVDNEGSGIEKSRGKAVVLGYVVCDIGTSADGMAYSAGGTSGNVSANLASLGWEVLLRARVGADAAGRVVRDDLTAAGVSVPDSFLDPGRSTPVVIIKTFPQPTYRFQCPSCGTRYARYRPIREWYAEDLSEVDAVFFDRASAAAVELGRRAHSDGKLVFFEPNSRGRAELFARAVATSHIVKFSDQRSSEFIEGLNDVPPDQIHIQTRGRDGFALRSGGGSWIEYSALEFSAVDSAGAGDMFTAALLDMMIDRRKSLPWTVRELSELAVEAQWFAAANTRRGGARALTRGRTRREVLAAVEGFRRGAPEAPSPSPGPTYDAARDCRSWLCPTVEAACSPRLVRRR